MGIKERAGERSAICITHGQNLDLASRSVPGRPDFFLHRRPQVSGWAPFARSPFVPLWCVCSLVCRSWIGPSPDANDGWRSGRLLPAGPGESQIQNEPSSWRQRRHCRPPPGIVSSVRAGFRPRSPRLTAPPRPPRWPDTIRSSPRIPSLKSPHLQARSSRARVMRPAKRTCPPRAARTTARSAAQRPVDDRQQSRSDMKCRREC